MSAPDNRAYVQLTDWQTAVLQAVNDEPGQHSGRIGFVACRAVGKRTTATSQAAIPTLDKLLRHKLVETRPHFGHGLSTRQWWTTTLGKEQLNAR